MSKLISVNNEFLLVPSNTDSTKVEAITVIDYWLWDVVAAF